MKKDLRSIGFSLIELLIVIGVIAILAGVLIIAVNPMQRIKGARDNTREAHVYQIWEAVNRKYIEEGSWSCGALGALPFLVDSENKPVFVEIGSGSGNYDLLSCLVPDYLSKPLFDPRQGSLEATGYQIWQHPVTRKVSIYSLYAESKVITIGVNPEEALSATTDYLHGWAWSPNIGWISLSSVTGGGEEPYGVVIDESDNLLGYAWSIGTTHQPGGLGWLDFDPEGPYPASPNHSAQIDRVNNKIIGWARFCSGTTNNDCQSPSRDDWDGWVLLGPIVVSSVDYGVSVNSSLSPMELTHWAYASEPVGWISFNCINTDKCSQNNYKVRLDKKHP